MRVLIGITYYYPNVSGLTFYIKGLAKALAEKGYEISVLTSRFNSSLATEEVVEGVRVRRSFVLFRIGKGVFMPFLPLEIFLQARKADVINCHLPQFESFLFAIVGKLLGKKVILTHHTDLSGWGGFFNRISEATLWSGQLLASLFADKIVPYTKDYADHSWYLKLFKSKLDYIYPPIKVGKIDNKLKKRWNGQIGKPKFIIGFSGRVAKQKGIPHLLRAIPHLKSSLGSFKIVFAGPYKEVVGERYFDEIKNLIDQYSDSLFFLGSVDHKKMSSFYSMCDVLVLPSDDRLESFGIVQVEAMLAGCPVVASELPGVVVPIKETGMGLLVEPGKSEDLARAIVKVIKDKKSFVKPQKEILKKFNYQDSINKYESLFKA